MVAELSVGRPKYEPFAATIEFARREGHRLETVMVGLAEADAAAFAGFMEASVMPRNTPEEIAARRAALARAAAAAIEPPRQMVLAAREIAAAAERLAGRSNLGVASDLDVASRLAEGAAHGAVAHVLVNLPALSNDAAAAALESECNRTLRSVVRLAQLCRTRVAKHSLRESEVPTGSVTSADERPSGTPS
jgi:formiminotetrahydrofolate cyclodeaminase